MNPQAIPSDHHQWLQRLHGEWTYDSAPAGTDDQDQHVSGQESVRSLGELWVVAGGQGDTPEGGVASTLTTLGWDPERGRFVGTLVGSMMTTPRVYEGELDESGSVLTLHTEGPSNSQHEQRARYRDVIETVDEDHRTLTSYVQGSHGHWKPMMLTRYQRKTSGH